MEEKLGKEEAKEVGIHKRPELKDELTKGLATKADLQLLRVELEAKIEKEILKLDRKFTFLFLILIFAIIFLNKDALEFIARLFGLVK